MLSIRDISHNYASECAEVIRASFSTVAEDFHFTKDTAPTFPAFIADEKIASEMQKTGSVFFGAFENEKLVGCSAITVGKNSENFYLERLAVLPEKRHLGAGKALVQKVEEAAKERNGKVVGLAIVDENKVLKGWYQKLGYKEISTKKFDLPFLVCFMEKNLSSN